MRKLLGLTIVGVAVLGCSSESEEPASGAVSQALEGSLGRTPWQMHDGLEVTKENELGLLLFLCDPRPQHGNKCEYDVATVPPADDLAWVPAPNPDIIGLEMPCNQSRVCSAPGGATCWVYGDFTYFQTFVTIPDNISVTEFTIAFSGMDDGSRVSIYNSSYPNGLVIEGSYVYLGGTGTTNLATYVVAGEVNRVVVTQVDDCCCENYLRSAVVVLNGEVIETRCTGPEDCDDGNACTDDVCNEDGSCANPDASCDDGNACTADSCDPDVGCSNTDISCDDGNACTADSCDPDVGCSNTEISCDDGDDCTLDTCDPALGCSNTDQCPDCSAAAASVGAIWPPNHRFVAIDVGGVTDPQGQVATIQIDGVFQDEPTDTLGDGRFCADADGVGTSTALVRAERSGTPAVPGDGRVYHIAFTATDPDGYTCSGEVTSCVPHDQGGGSSCVDQGALYDSRVCE
jgi:hypothetical protein